MDQEILSLIFSVKKKQWQIGTEGEKGTGLGLILCRQFIEQHGGKIWIESARPGNYSQLYVASGMNGSGFV